MEGEVAKEVNETGNNGQCTGAGKAEIKWAEGMSGKAIEFRGKVGDGQWAKVPNSYDMNFVRL